MELVSRGIKISDIKLRSPPVRTPLGRPKFYVEIKYNSKRKARTTKKYPDGDCVCWEESIPFEIAEITDESMIIFTVTKIHIPEIIIETIGSVGRNVVNLIRFGHSGPCELEISKDSQLTFSIEKMSNILPIMIDEASKSIARTQAVENQEDALSLFLSRFEIFKDVIDAVSELNPYAKLAWSILSLIPKTILSHKNRNESIGKLCEKLKEVYDYITDAARLPELNNTHTQSSRSKTLLLLVQQTVECAYLLKEYGTGSIVGKVWRGGSIDDKIKSFNEKLDHYQSAITGSIILETGIVTLRIAETTAKIAETIAKTKDVTILDGVPYAEDAGFISGKRCLPGTRQHLIDQIVEWVNGDAPQQILLLSGQAGTGKSAVAHTIAELFKTQNRLGSMFCFNKLEGHKDRYKILFSTISRDLADHDVLWRESLAKIIRDTSVKKSKDPVTQFNELIAKPSKNVETVGPVVIVIDALDESGDREERATILDLLFRRCSELPDNYRIIVTSRPEQDIELLRADSDNIQCIRMGDIATAETLSDIQSYVLDQLKSIAPTLNKIEEHWSQILAKHAEGLFQWADTACRHINPHIRRSSSVRKRWMDCVSSSSSSLSKLYEGIISSQEESEDPEFVDDFKSIVSAIITAREPLSVDALQNIFQEVIPDVRDILYPFGSLFRGVNDLNTPIQPLHTSLLDFFTDSSTKYHIDISDQGLFTLGCLKVMNQMLRFNICNLETSHLSNRDVPNFSKRVATAIPSHLRYACYFWALHLNSLHSTDTDKIVTEIHTLMEKNLLFWFEVLSLLNDIEQGCSAMAILRDWSQDAGSDLATLATRASDAYRFGLTCKGAMSGSTPHLYLSALPFASRSSFISKQYLPRYPQLFSLDIDQVVDFALTEIGVTKKHTSSVTISRLAFSPCDRYIASGFENGEICLLDYKTGEQINQLKPRPNTESNRISDIVFSPDGELIYGCFRSARRILIWNVKTNDVKEHSYDSVIERSFGISTISSDGQYIAFESILEVLLYDRVGGSIIGRFNRHLAKKTSYQFSPNGNLFAFVKEKDPEGYWKAPAEAMSSGTAREGHRVAFAEFRTNASVGEVNLWNTRERKRVQYWNNSFGLALSDSYIAVLKFDGCMEVWDLTAMKLVHSLTNRNPIGSEFAHIQFSANDQYVLSSCRNTYRIWTLSTGELIHQSHANGTIDHLALSPDLKYIALAGSDDAGTTYIQQWTPRIVQQPSLDDLNNGSLFVRNIWLHGAYLVLVFDHGLLQIWDITTMNTIVFEVMIGRHSAAMVFSVEDVVYVAYGVQSAGGNLMGFTYRYELRLWDESGGQPMILDESEGTVTALAFSASNNYLIIGVGIVGRGILKIWDIHERRFVVEPCSVEGTPKTLALSSSGTSVLVAYIKDYSDAYFEIRECQPGLQVLNGPFRCTIHSKFLYDDEIAFSADKVIFMSHNGVVIFEAATGKKVGWIGNKEARKHLRWLSPDGKYLAWVKDRKLKLWDMDSNRLLLEDLTEGDPSVLCFSSDSKQLIAIARTKDQDSKRTRVRYYCITIWDMQTMKPIMKKVRYPEFKSDVLAFHDGNLVLDSNSPPKIFWNLYVLSAAATLYNQYIGEASFGTFPVNSSKFVCDTSIPITKSSSADNTDSKVLDYSLTAWNKALFSNFSKMDKNGWVLGPHEELVFWVPKEKREGLWYPGMIHMSTKKITKLNFDNFVHGTSWTECRKAL